MSWSKKLVLLLSGFGAIVVLSRCSGSTGTNSNSATPTFTTVYANVLQPACASCHSPTGTATLNSGTKLDFSSQANAYTTLVGPKVQASTLIGTCGSVSLVTAGNASTSFVAAEVVLNYATSNFGGEAGCSPTYHVSFGYISSTTLSPTETGDLISWINGGAVNN